MPSLPRSLQKFEKTLEEGLKTAYSYGDSELCGQRLVELWEGVRQRLAKGDEAIRGATCKYEELLCRLAEHESVLYLRGM